MEQPIPTRTITVPWNWIGFEVLLLTNYGVHHVRGGDRLPQYGERGWEGDWCPPPLTYMDHSQRWLPPWDIPGHPDSSG